MKITPANSIKAEILGKNGVKDSIRYNGKHYAYKTHGDYYYIYNTFTGTRHRISKWRYKDF